MALTHHKSSSYDTDRECTTPYVRVNETVIDSLALKIGSELFVSSHTPSSHFRPTTPHTRKGTPEVDDFGVIEITIVCYLFPSELWYANATVNNK